MNFAKIFSLLLVFLFTNVSQASFINKHISHYVFAYIDNNEKLIFKYLLKNYKVNPDAAYMLGYFYLKNNDINIAEYYFKIASKSNHLLSINSLGDIFYSDRKDIKKALEYYEIAANKGYGPSQFNAGIIYLKHIKNPTKAKYWLKKASLNISLNESIKKSAEKYIINN